MSLDKYILYDPLKSNKLSSLPDKEGCYLILLRPNHTFIENEKIPIVPIFTSIDYSNEILNVVFIGIAQNMREELTNHLFGKTGSYSLFGKLIGCLMGYTLRIDETSSATEGSGGFSIRAEKSIKKWIKENLLFLYNVDKEQQYTEQDMIEAYNPPLNVINNHNKINSQYRNKLLRLSNKTKSKAKSSQRNNAYNTSSVDIHKLLLSQEKIAQKQLTDGQVAFCPQCGIKIQVLDVMKNEKELVCPICGLRFMNPLYITTENGGLKNWFFDKNGITTTKGGIFIAAVICILIFMFSNVDTSVDTNSESYKRGAIRYYLKREYLKDPDSYKPIDWEFTQSGDKYYVRHKYRAKNSFGGYVVEEKTFVFDTDGNMTVLN